MGFMVGNSKKEGVICCHTRWCYRMGIIVRNSGGVANFLPHRMNATERVIIVWKLSYQLSNRSQQSAIPRQAPTYRKLGSLLMLILFCEKKWGGRWRVTPDLGTSFHTDSNGLVFASIALTLTEILFDCDLTCSPMCIDRWSVSSMITCLWRKSPSVANARELKIQPADRAA